MKACKQCKASIPKDAKKCQHCGSAQEMGSCAKGCLVGLGLIVLLVIYGASLKEVSKNSAKPSDDLSTIKLQPALTPEQQAAFDKTKAGKLCKQHPDWSHDDCQGVADNKIWIGMSYDMLVARRGKPNSASPSNFGNGNEWQWCWYDYTPSCFYGKDDGIVRSYN